MQVPRLARHSPGHGGLRLAQGRGHLQAGRGGVLPRPGGQVLVQTTLAVAVLLCCVREAGDIIRSHNGSRPLFLYVAFQAAHGPIMTPPRQYLDMYNTGGVSRHHLNRAATISVG